MSDLFEELEQAEKVAAKPKRSAKKQFNNALAETSRSKTARAAGRTTHKGNYWARTLRLPPAYQDIVLDIYKQEPRAKSIADIERWLFAKGLEAYLVRGERPDYAETIERQIELPAFRED